MLRSLPSVLRVSSVLPRGSKKQAEDEQVATVGRMMELLADMSNDINEALQQLERSLLQSVSEEISGWATRFESRQVSAGPDTLRSPYKDRASHFSVAERFHRTASMPPCTGRASAKQQKDDDEEGLDMRLPSLARRTLVYQANTSLLTDDFEESSDSEDDDELEDEEEETWDTSEPHRECDNKVADDEEPCLADEQTGLLADRETTFPMMPLHWDVRKVAKVKATKARKGFCVTFDAPDDKEDKGPMLPRNRKSVKKGRAEDESHSYGDCSCGENLQKHCHTIVTSYWFDLCSCGLVISSAVLIGVQQELAQDSVILDYVQGAFNWLFTLELLLKLQAYQQKFFTMSEWTWNIFDLVLVTICVLNQGFNLLIFCKVINHQRSGTQAQIVRLLRIPRLVRIVRLVRVLRSFPELRTLVVCITGSLRSLVWTLVVLTVIMYTVGVILTLIVDDHLSGVIDLTEKDEDLRRYYGSVMTSVYYLFAGVVGGISWTYLSEPLFEVSLVSGPLFCFYIAFCYFAVMNVVTGVFVDKAIRTAEQDRDTQSADTLQQLFDNDAKVSAKHRVSTRDEHQYITWPEFESKLSCPQMAAYLDELNVSAQDAAGLFDLLDEGGQGRIAKADFISAAFRLRGPAKALELAIFSRDSQKAQNRMWDKLSGLQSTLAELGQILLSAEHHSEGERSPCEADTPTPSDAGCSIGIASINRA
eukprot:TRINITY_DN13335_c0_g2_i1.p1 TRINITY_DN13335_c0_g2~~TRINITY_DN13335_c0_g2_i1.p1  ORF type:complete len:705 (+),score=175.58 TRINITY_DN13335_c0_g2_i1:150-2264(+)